MSAITLQRLEIVFFSSDVGKTYEDAKTQKKMHLIRACEDLILSRSMVYTFLACTIIFGVMAHTAALPAAIVGLGLSVCVLLTGTMAYELYEDILKYEKQVHLALKA